MSNKHHSPRRQPRKAYRPRAVHANAVQIAINGARRLSAADVDLLAGEQQRALNEFSQGKNCPDNWRRLGDAANVAETMAAMGLGSGQQADEVIAQAKQALRNCAERHHQRATWTLYAQELDALTWLLRLQRLQLQVCSYSEFCAAIDTTQQRIRQAVAGNAPAGAVLVQAPIPAPSTTTCSTAP